MSLPSHFTDDAGFAQLSDGFVNWLKRSPGVRLSPKIQIADLRFESAGRGVGKLMQLFSFLETLFF